MNGISQASVRATMWRMVSESLRRISGICSGRLRQLVRREVSTCSRADAALPPSADSLLSLEGMEGALGEWMALSKTEL